MYSIYMRDRELFARVSIQQRKVDSAHFLKMQSMEISLHNLL